MSNKNQSKNNKDSVKAEDSSKEKELSKSQESSTNHSSSKESDTNKTKKAKKKQAKKKPASKSASQGKTNSPDSKTAEGSKKDTLEKSSATKSTKGTNSGVNRDLGIGGMSSSKSKSETKNHKEGGKENSKEKKNTSEKEKAEAKSDKDHKKEDVADASKKEAKKGKWKKPLGIILLIAALCGVGCVAKYKYDEETNVLSLKVDKNMPIQLEEKTANKFKAKDIVRKCTGNLKISGKLSSQKYKKQPITFTYTKGWSTKKETVNILVIKANTEPKIVLKNSLINVQKDDKDFKPSNVIKSIKDCKGNTIPLKSHTKIYKKDLKKKKNIAYFTGDQVDVSKTGVYTVKLKVFDNQGVRSEASFVVNVTNDKKASDKKIEEIKNNIFHSNESGSQSGNVEIREEVVDSGNDYRPASSTSSGSNSGNNSSSTASGTNGNASFVIRDDTNNSSSNHTKKPANEPTVTPEPEEPATPAVDNSTVFSDYRAALEKAKASGNHVETTQDSKGNTIYVIVE